MACALSESIFCWPRTRFLRDRFPAEAACVLVVGFVPLAEFAVLLRGLWATVLATGLVAAASPGELARALAAEKAQVANTQIAVNPTPRISVQTFNAKPLLQMKSPTRRWPCNHPRLDVAMPVFVGPVSVTEVYPPERWFHPAAMNLGTAPGTQRPGRSSDSTRSGRILPRC